MVWVRVRVRVSIRVRVAPGVALADELPVFGDAFGARLRVFGVDCDGGLGGGDVPQGLATLGVDGFGLGVGRVAELELDGGAGAAVAAHGEAEVWRGVCRGMGRDAVWVGGVGSLTYYCFPGSCVSARVCSSLLLRGN